MVDRSLEDIDTYHRHNPSLVVIKEKDEISIQQPQRFVEVGTEDVGRAVGSGGLTERRVHGNGMRCVRTMLYKIDFRMSMIIYPIAAMTETD